MLIFRLANAHPILCFRKHFCMFQLRVNVYIYVVIYVTNTLLFLYYILYYIYDIFLKSNY